MPQDEEDPLHFPAITTDCPLRAEVRGLGVPPLLPLLALPLLPAMPTDLNTVTGMQFHLTIMASEMEDLAVPGAQWAERSARPRATPRVH